MGYHATRDCDISPWIKDGVVAHSLWGLKKKQINIGLGLFFFNISHLKQVGEPTWGRMVQDRLCPTLEPRDCICSGINVNWQDAGPPHDYRCLSFPEDLTGYKMSVRVGAKNWRLCSRRRLSWGVSVGFEL